MHVLCVIPARLGSTRLPHKPLRLLAGEPLIRHVVRRVLQERLADRVVVATDHEAVAEVVRPLGAEAVLTRAEHPSGTDRVAEVAAREEFAAEVVLNVQGDDPLFLADAVQLALSRVMTGDDLATAATPLTPDAMLDPNRVKVVVDPEERALRFSRAYPASGAWACGVEVLQHLGVYAYRRPALLAWAGWPPSDEERAEGLEQLRPLAHGLPMTVARVVGPAWPSVDAEADLMAVEAVLTMRPEYEVAR